jgi:hypothetical protein
MTYNDLITSVKKFGRKYKLEQINPSLVERKELENSITYVYKLSDKNIFINVDKDTKDIKVGCDCEDYKYTWKWFNEKFSCNVIKDELVEPSKNLRNKDKLPGFCKHIYYCLEEVQKGFKIR